MGCWVAGLPGLSLLFYRLETWWGRNPKAMVRFTQSLQQNSFSEGEVGRCARFMLFTFGGRAVSSSKKDVRHAFAKNILFWLSNGDDKTVQHASACLKHCNEALGRFHGPICAVLETLQATEFRRVRETLLRRLLELQACWQSAAAHRQGTKM